MSVYPQRNASLWSNSKPPWFISMDYMSELKNYGLNLSDLGKATGVHSGCTSQSQNEVIQTSGSFIMLQSSPRLILLKKNKHDTYARLCLALLLFLISLFFKGTFCRGTISYVQPAQDLICITCSLFLASLWRLARLREPSETEWSTALISN